MGGPHAVIMLSQAEAQSFLSYVLKLCDVERKLQESKYDLLCEILRAFHEVVPFQSLTLVAQPFSDRHKPTLTEVLTEVRSGRGGLCYTLNIFMKFLLEALDYDVYLVNSTVARPNDHVMTIACIHGEKYLVEVGCGYPTFKPIPLNFREESPTYEHSFIKYKFKWVSEYKIERQNLFFTPGATWRRFYSFNITPKSLQDIDKRMNEGYMYTSSNALLFHNTLRAVKFTNGKAICIRNMKLLKEDDTHILQETELASGDEFLEAVKEHFPMLVEPAKRALANWVPKQ